MTSISRSQSSLWRKSIPCVSIPAKRAFSSYAQYWQQVQNDIEDSFADVRHTTPSPYIYTGLSPSRPHSFLLSSQYHIPTTITKDLVGSGLIAAHLSHLSDYEFSQLTLKEAVWAIQDCHTNRHTHHSHSSIHRILLMHHEALSSLSNPSDILLMIQATASLSHTPHFHYLLSHYRKKLKDASSLSFDSSLVPSLPTASIDHATDKTLLPVSPDGPVIKKSRLPISTLPSPLSPLLSTLSLSYLFHPSHTSYLFQDEVFLSVLRSATPAEHFAILHHLLDTFSFFSPFSRALHHSADLSLSLSDLSPILSLLPIDQTLQSWKLICHSPQIDEKAFQNAILSLKALSRLSALHYHQETQSSQLLSHFSSFLSLFCATKDTWIHRLTDTELAFTLSKTLMRFLKYPLLPPSLSISLHSPKTSSNPSPLNDSALVSLHKALVSSLAPSLISLPLQKALSWTRNVLQIDPSNPYIPHLLVQLWGEGPSSQQANLFYKHLLSLPSFPSALLAASPTTSLSATMDYYLLDGILPTTQILYRTYATLSSSISSTSLRPLLTVLSRALSECDRQREKSIDFPSLPPAAVPPWVALATASAFKPNAPTSIYLKYVTSEEELEKRMDNDWEHLLYNFPPALAFTSVERVMNEFLDSCPETLLPRKEYLRNTPFLDVYFYRAMGSCLRILKSISAPLLSSSSTTKFHSPSKTISAANSTPQTDTSVKYFVSPSKTVLPSLPMNRHIHRLRSRNATTITSPENASIGLVSMPSSSSGTPPKGLFSPPKHIVPLPSSSLLYHFTPSSPLLSCPPPKVSRGEWTYECLELSAALFRLSNTLSKLQRLITASPRCINSMSISYVENQKKVHRYIPQVPLVSTMGAIIHALRQHGKTFAMCTYPVSHRMLHLLPPQQLCGETLMTEKRGKDVRFEGKKAHLMKKPETTLVSSDPSRYAGLLWIKVGKEMIEAMKTSLPYLKQRGVTHSSPTLLSPVPSSRYSLESLLLQKLTSSSFSSISSPLLSSSLLFSSSPSLSPLSHPTMHLSPCAKRPLNTREVAVTESFVNELEMYFKTLRERKTRVESSMKGLLDEWKNGAKDLKNALRAFEFDKEELKDFSLTEIKSYCSLLQEKGHSISDMAIFLQTILSQILKDSLRKQREKDLINERLLSFSYSSPLISPPPLCSSLLSSPLLPSYTLPLTSMSRLHSLKEEKLEVHCTQEERDMIETLEMTLHLHENQASLPLLEQWTEVLQCRGYSLEASVEFLHLMTMYLSLWKNREDSFLKERIIPSLREAIEIVRRKLCILLSEIVEQHEKKGRKSTKVEKKEPKKRGGLVKRQTISRQTLERAQTLMGDNIKEKLTLCLMSLSLDKVFFSEDLMASLSSEGEGDLQHSFQDLCAALSNEHWIRKNQESLFRLPETTFYHTFSRALMLTRRVALQRREECERLEREEDKRQSSIGNQEKETIVESDTTDAIDSKTEELILKSNTIPNGETTKQQRLAKRKEEQERKPVKVNLSLGGVVGNHFVEFVGDEDVKYYPLATLLDKSQKKWTERMRHFKQPIVYVLVPRHECLHSQSLMKGKGGIVEEKGEYNGRGIISNKLTTTQLDSIQQHYFAIGSSALKIKHLQLQGINPVPIFAPLWNNIDTLNLRKHYITQATLREIKKVLQSK